jgi:glucose-6-phosphate 1-dehydrogenase
MEPPVDTSADALRDEKVKVLRAMPPLDLARVVRGQYEGYRDEAGVDAGSDVETYVALETSIESWRWAGVPFYIRAGKALAATATEVLVEFRRPPLQFFARCDAPPPHPNHLRFLIKPGGQVALEIQVKAPGGEMVSHPVELTYRYDERTEEPREEAYQRLLDDALDGDQRLFARADGVEAAWRVVEPVLTSSSSPHRYEQASWGPAAADELIAGDGGWHKPGGDDRG